MVEIKCYDYNGNRITEFFQWDVDQEVYVGGAPTSPLPIVQFSNDRCKQSISITPTLSGDRLLSSVPNSLLQEESPITIFVYDHGDDGYGKTIGHISIPVIKRVKPETEG